MFSVVVCLMPWIISDSNNPNFLLEFMGYRDKSEIKPVFESTKLKSEEGDTFRHEDVILDTSPFGRYLSSLADAGEPGLKFQSTLPPTSNSQHMATTAQETVRQVLSSSEILASTIFFCSPAAYGIIWGNFYPYPGSPQTAKGLANLPTRTKYWSVAVAAVLAGLSWAASSYTHIADGFPRLSASVALVLPSLNLFSTLMNARCWSSWEACSQQVKLLDKTREDYHKSVKKVLRLIMEVELVSRGYHLGRSSSTAIRIDSRSAKEQRHSKQLRALLTRSLHSLLHHTQATNIRIVALGCDEVSSKSIVDSAASQLQAPEEFVDDASSKSLSELKALASLVHRVGQEGLRRVDELQKQLMEAPQGFLMSGIPHAHRLAQVAKRLHGLLEQSRVRTLMADACLDRWLQRRCLTSGQLYPLCSPSDTIEVSEHPLALRAVVLEAVHARRRLQSGLARLELLLQRCDEMAPRSNDSIITEPGQRRGMLDGTEHSDGQGGMEWLDNHSKDLLRRGILEDIEYVSSALEDGNFACGAAKTALHKALMQSPEAAVHSGGNESAKDADSTSEYESTEPNETQRLPEGLGEALLAVRADEDGSGQVFTGSGAYQQDYFPDGRENTQFDSDNSVSGFRLNLEMVSEMRSVLRHRLSAANFQVKMVGDPC